MSIRSTLTTEFVNRTAQMQLTGFTAPKSDPKAPPGTEQKVGLLMSWAQWGSYIALAIALIIFFGRMGFQKRHGGEIEMGALGWILVGVIGVGAAVAIITTIANA
jgi:hypothetical protein